jgi:hypothetical protein
MLLNDLVTLCVAASVGVANSTIFYGSQVKLPTSGALLSIIEYGGTAPERAQTKAYRRPSAQFTARASTLAAARTLANAAYNAVNIRNTSVGGTFYREISPNQEPFDLGQQDANGRVQYVFNVNVIHG